MPVQKLVIIFLLLLSFYVPVSAEQHKSFGLFLGLSNREISKALPELSKYDLIVVDGESTSKDNVNTLQANGVTVLGYLSIGTIESGRSWYSLVKDYKLDFWPEWQEWYAEVSNVEFRKVILRKVLPKMLRKNFSGIFLDNVDMVISHPTEFSGMKRLVRKFSVKLREQNKLLYAQNGEQSILRFAKYLDGWNQEGVNFSYSFSRNKYVATSQKHQQKIASLAYQLQLLGLETLFTSYLAKPDFLQIDSAKQFACEQNSIAFISNIQLKAVTEPIICD